MTEYLFVGGPADGRRMTVGEARIVRIPDAPQLLQVGGQKIIPFRRNRFADLTIGYTEYERFGAIYWWEGLIGDALGQMDVSAELAADGGPALRATVRGMMRRQLQELDEGKQLGRIVWRLTYDPLQARFTVKAFVGPRAVPFALMARDERRAALGALERRKNG